MSKDLSGISPQEFRQLQAQIDVEKWLASERAGRDLCGCMTWCVYCIKGEEYPCAKAQLREKMDQALAETVKDEAADETAAAREEEAISGSASTDEALEEAVAEEVAATDAAERTEEESLQEAESSFGDLQASVANHVNVVAAEEISSDNPGESDGKKQKSGLRDGIEDAAAAVTVSPKGKKDCETEKVAVPDGYELVTRYRRSFRARLIQSPVLQDLYTEIKNALLGLGGVKSRVGQNGENFRVGKERIAKLCVSGKTLSLYLSLAPSMYEDTKYHYEDMTDKKSHAETPMRIKITGKRTLKQAKALLRDLASKYGLASVGSFYSDFHYAYQDDAALIAKGLIRTYQVVVKKKTK